MTTQWYVNLAQTPLVDNKKFAIYEMDKAELFTCAGHTDISIREWRPVVNKTKRKSLTTKKGFHNTAIARKTVPAPIQWFVNRYNPRKTHWDILYHGCGKDDIGTEALVDYGFIEDHRKSSTTVCRYDPYHPDPEVRKFPTETFDEIFSIYVLNVVPQNEGRKILREIYSLLKPKGTAIIAVRRDI